MGEVTFGDIKAEFEHRVDAGEFIGVAQRPGAPGRAFTTREMIDLGARDDRADARGTASTQSALSQRDDARTSRHDHPHLNERPARRGRADPGEPRPGHGAGRRGRRREDDRPRRGS